MESPCCFTPFAAFPLGGFFFGVRIGDDCTACCGDLNFNLNEAKSAESRPPMLIHIQACYNTQAARVAPEKLNTDSMPQLNWSVDNQR